MNVFLLGSLIASQRATPPDPVVAGATEPEEVLCDGVFASLLGLPPKQSR